jgi:peptidoglycan hydrolase CwlO-like protein
LKKTFQLPADTIYTILQNHFRHSASTYGTGWAKGQYDTSSHFTDGFLPSIPESTEKRADAQREIDELRAIIQTMREELVAYSNQLRDAQRDMENQRAIIESRDKLLLDLQKNLEETSHMIEELREHYSGSVTA